MAFSGHLSGRDPGAQSSRGRHPFVVAKPRHMALHGRRSYAMARLSSPDDGRACSGS